MIKRTITVVVGLPIVLLLVYLGGLPLILFCIAMALVGLKELYMALSGKHLPIHWVGYGFAVAYFAVLHFLTYGAVMIALTAFVIAIQVALVIFFNKLTLKDCIATVYGALYIPFLLGFIVLVRGHELGHYFVWLIFTSAFGCDTFAYLAGTTIGKHKLKGTPSPNKSVEGLFGGVIGAAGVGALYGLGVVRFGTPDSQFVIQATVISAVGAVFCIFGDMAASAIKRHTGIKDFGNLFPGHGGVVDRIDSILLAAPVIFVFMTYL